MSSRPALPKQLSSIGEWKLGQPFGHGNHAIIRQGRSKTDGSEVVIKELAKTSPRTDGLLRQEAVIMAFGEMRTHQGVDKLKHQNLVKLHMHVETSDRLFLVMHYAKGGDLLDAVMGNEKRRLSAPVAKQWFAQLLLGVDYLHQHKIVHMDIKPDNVFIDEDCNVLIGDYGLSRFYNPDTPSLTARPGTLHYSAPECFSRWLLEQGWSDARSYFMELGIPLTHRGEVVVYGPELDVWALGVCLYVMLTGKYPFWGTGDTQAQEDFATIETILFQEAPRWPFWIESECIDMLLRIFDKNPRTRITIKQLLKHPWVRDEVQAEVSKIESAINAGMTPRMSPLTSPMHSPLHSPLHSPHRSPLASPQGSPTRHPSSPHRSPSNSPRPSPVTSPATVRVTGRSASTNSSPLVRRASRSNLLRLHQQHQAQTNLLAAALEQQQMLMSRSAKKSSKKKTKKPAPRLTKAKKARPKSTMLSGSNPRAQLLMMHETYSCFSDLHAALLHAVAHKAKGSTSSLSSLDEDGDSTRE